MASLCAASSIFYNWEKTAAISKGPTKERKKIACNIFVYPLCHSPALRRGGKGRERHARQGKDWMQGRCRSCATGSLTLCQPAVRPRGGRGLGTPHCGLQSDTNLNLAIKETSVARCVPNNGAQGIALAGWVSSGCLPAPRVM